MNTLNVLSWQNESTLSPYPLSKSIVIDNFIIDANFVQFDAFIPVLKSITANNDTFFIEIEFDQLTKIVEVSKNDLVGSPYTVVINEDGRYLGKLVLGPDANTLYEEIASRELKYNTKFLAFLVKSIPSACGVYKIGNFYGELNFSSVDYISYDVAGLKVTFSAVSLPNETNEIFLKTLNGVHPAQNGVYLQDSETIKIVGSGAGTIQISQVGTSVGNLVADQNNTIITNQLP